MDRLLARGGSNDISKDVFSISVIKNWIYNKGKLIFAKITAQNSKIKENFAWISFFFVMDGSVTFCHFWTLKLHLFIGKNM